MKKKYDIGSKMQNIVEGSAVWLHNPHRTKGLCPKLQRNWEGPSFFDPNHFPVILNYLRNDGRYHSDMLPRDLRQLKELQVEVAFYELKHLELNIQRRILDLQHGHFLL
jgi:hypothetical protein